MKIEIQNITFRYDKSRNIINDLSLNLNDDKVVAIVGVSGCGKSTLMRLISGLIVIEKDNFFEGKITVNELSPVEYRQRGKLSFMFQEPALLPNLSVYANIALPFRIKGILNGQEKVDAVIETVGLTAFKNYLPKSLSGGMKTRVSLARSFITQPELLLLDEPFSALDVAWKTEIYEELKTLKEKFNTTVLFVTHNIDEALALSNKVLILGVDGNIIKDYVVSDNNKQELFKEIHQSIINDHNKRFAFTNEK